MFNKHSKFFEDLGECTTCQREWPPSDAEMKWEGVAGGKRDCKMIEERGQAVAGKSKEGEGRKCKQGGGGYTEEKLKKHRTDWVRNEMTLGLVLTWINTHTGTLVLQDRNLASEQNMLLYDNDDDREVQSKRSENHVNVSLTNSWYVCWIKIIFRETDDQTRLANTTITDKQQFEEEVVFLCHRSFRKLTLKFKIPCVSLLTHNHKQAL